MAVPLPGASGGGFVGTTQAQYGGGSPGPVDVDASDLPGDGTNSNPYEISNVSELQAMEDDLDANYELVSDIDASNTAQFNDGRGFDPVGDIESVESTPPPFTGVFDGNDHTIAELTIDRPTEDYVGLFALSSGTLTNITLTEMTVAGDSNVGGLVGDNRDDGAIRNATASGSVSGINNEDGFSGNNVGGLVGFNTGTIGIAGASGNVTGGNNVGGLVGNNNVNGNVTNARASGSVTGNSFVGGLVGGNVGNVTDTFAVGPVTGSSNSVVGGLVGSTVEVEGITNGTIEHSYFDEGGTGQSRSAGGAGVTGLATARMRGQAAASNLTGFDFANTWTTTDGYPALRALSEESGGITSTNVTLSETESTVTVTITATPESGNTEFSFFHEFNQSVASVSDITTQVAGSSVSPLIENENQTVATVTLRSSDVTAGEQVRIEYTITTAETDGKSVAITGSVTNGETRDLPEKSYTVTADPSSFVAEIPRLPSTVVNGGSITQEVFVRNNTRSPAQAQPATAIIEVTIENATGNTVDTVDEATVDIPAGELRRVNLSGTVDVDFPGEFVLVVAINDTVQVSPTLSVTDPDDGDGSPSNPYEISTASELQAMEDDLDASYELVSDIDASNTAQFNSGRGFDPVGRDSFRNEFTGSFDGNGYTITGLTVDRPGEDDVGLFGVSSGTITGVTLTDVSATGDSSVGGLVGINTGTIVTAGASGSVTGEDRVGGLVGDNEGTIRDSTASGSVNGTARFVGGLVGDNSEDGTIRDSTASGNATGDSNVGGLAGLNFRGAIRDATASGSVTGDNVGEDRVGGLVGSNLNGTIRDSTASGSVSGAENVGGLIGVNTGNITDTFAVGVVTGDSDVGDARFVGGLVGANVRGGTVEESYFDTQATGQSTSAGTAVGLTTAEMQGSTAKQNMRGLAFGETWQTASGNYPEFVGPSESGSNDELLQAATAFASGEISITDLGNVSTAFAQGGAGAITSSDVTLSDPNPTPRSDVTVTVTATPESGTTGFSFRHEFDQSVATASDITTQVAGSSVVPLIAEVNQNGATAAFESGSVTAGEQVAIEYTVTTTDTIDKSVSIGGDVTNGETQDLPERSYTTATASVDATRTLSATEVTNGSTVSVTVEAEFDTTVDNARLENFIDGEGISEESFSVTNQDGGSGVITSFPLGVNFTWSSQSGTGLGSDSFTVEYELTIPKKTPLGTTIMFEGTVTDEGGDDTATITGDTQLEVVSATSDTPETVTVGNQEVPTEFTSETSSGERTVTADNAVSAINTFIGGGASADVAVDVINAFIASS